MKVYRNPKRSDWPPLCERPSIDRSELKPKVEALIEDVRLRGDESLFELTTTFDKVKLSGLSLEIPKLVQVDEQLKIAIDVAWQNIHRFHAAQKQHPEKIETTEGVFCWRKSIAIEKVGLYIPGGSAPLFSTLLMLGIPATIAGCTEIVVCTPPQKDASVDSAILYVAQKLGLKQIFTVGGAQSIAAMTFGTQTIPKVDKIFGPGNQYVTMAKQLVQQHGMAIDMPAGPSEVLVIADESCEPAFVAADLLSQAEHGADSQVVLVFCRKEELGVRSEKVLDGIQSELKQQLEALPRKDIASLALKNSVVVIVDSYDQAMAFSNLYAPEHLIIATKNADEMAENVVNAGSVFIGNFSCESAGDYASGTNHTLPTNGYARSHSGVSLDSFVKKVTFQKLTVQGIRNIGPSIETMAAAEQLDAHRNAVSIRLKNLGHG